MRRCAGFTCSCGSALELGAGAAVRQRRHASYKYRGVISRSPVAAVQRGMVPTTKKTHDEPEREMPWDSRYKFPMPDAPRALPTAVDLLEAEPEEPLPPAVTTSADLAAAPDTAAAAAPSYGPVAGSTDGTPLYQHYEPKDKEHYPAAGVADAAAFNRTVEHYESPGDVGNTLVLPRMTFRPQSLMGTRTPAWKPYSYKTNGTPSYLQVPPGTLQAHRLVQPMWQGRKWVPPASEDTTWDFTLDQPVSPLLLAPNHWDSLPLVDETVHPEVPREAKDTETVVDEATGARFQVTPNIDQDTLPVSNVQRPHHYSKQYGMPLTYQEGPIQWASQLHKPERIAAVEKTLSLRRDPSKPGQDMEVLCIGDTMTIGSTYGSDTWDPAGRFWAESEDGAPREYPYAIRLHQLLNCDVTVAGVYGEGTDTMRDRLLQHLESRRRRGLPQPAVVVLWAGTFDLMDPDRTAGATAQNLMRMHHVAHTYGCKTINLGLASVPNRPFGQFMGARVLEINKAVEEFTRDRRERMCHVDLYKMLGRRTGQASTTHRRWASSLGPAWFANHFVLTHLGYDRVAELLYKQMKHKPGFLMQAIPDRFYDNPCNEPLPDDRIGTHWRDTLSDVSRRRATATPDLYGSTAVSKLSTYRMAEGRGDPGGLDAAEERFVTGFRRSLVPTEPTTDRKEQQRLVEPKVPHRNNMSLHAHHG